MVTIEQADTYFLTRLFSEEWNNSLDKESALVTAENMIKSKFLFKYTDYVTRQPYIHGVCEQAIFLLQYMKSDRYKLQEQGVNSYRVDDISFNMKQTLISPVVKELLKPLLLKAGRVQ
jgi:hypothetical protein